MSQDKSTNECVDVLLNEIAAGGGSDAGGAERRVYKSNLHELLQWIYVSSNQIICIFFYLMSKWGCQSNYKINNVREIELG